MHSCAHIHATNMARADWEKDLLWTQSRPVHPHLGCTLVASSTVCGHLLIDPLSPSRRSEVSIKIGVMRYGFKCRLTGMSCMDLMQRLGVPELWWNRYQSNALIFKVSRKDCQCQYCTVLAWPDFCSEHEEERITIHQVQDLVKLGSVGNADAGSVPCSTARRDETFHSTTSDIIIIIINPSRERQSSLTCIRLGILISTAHVPLRRLLLLWPGSMAAAANGRVLASVEKQGLMNG